MKKKQFKMPLIGLLFWGAFAIPGCRSMEIGLKEKLGIPKRDQMVKEVTRAHETKANLVCRLLLEKKKKKTRRSTTATDTVNT